MGMGGGSVKRGHGEQAGNPTARLKPKKKKAAAKKKPTAKKKKR